MNALVSLPASRRAVLSATLATMAALPARALAVTDPVYGAMARHRTAYDACMEGLARTNCGRDIDDDDRAGKRRWRDVQNAEGKPSTPWALDQADDEGWGHRLRKAGRRLRDYNDGAGSLAPADARIPAGGLTGPAGPQLKGGFRAALFTCGSGWRNRTHNSPNPVGPKEHSLLAYVGWKSMASLGETR